MSKTSDKYIFDTCIFIDFWRGLINAKDILLKSKRESWIRYISAYSIAELWVGVGKSKIPNTESEHENMISDFFKVDLNEKLAKIAGHLKAKYQIGLPDCIILATAKYYRFVLVTSDKDHHNAALSEGLQSVFIEKV